MDPHHSPSRESEPSSENAESVVSRRMRLLALRKRDKRPLKQDEERKNVVAKMKKQSKASECTVSRLDARVQLLDILVSKCLPDDAFLGRKELNPWRFRNSDQLKKKWDFVNNVVMVQEFLVAVSEARDRKRQELLQASKSSGSPVCPVDVRSEAPARDATVPTNNTVTGHPTAPVSGTPVGEKSPASLRPSPDGESDKCTGDHELTSSTDDGKRESIDKNDNSHNNHNVNASDSQTKTIGRMPYPVVGKATVYASGRRTYPKKSKANSDVENPTLDYTLNSTVDDNETWKGNNNVEEKDLKNSLKVEDNRLHTFPGNSHSHSTEISNLNLSDKTASGLTKRESQKQPGVSNSSAKHQKHGGRLTSRKPKPSGFMVKNLSKHEQIQIQAQRFERNSIIFGFGSHHRTDTCEYCGRSPCPGQMARTQDIRQGKSSPQRHYRGLLPSPEMKRRVDDMKGIYKQTTESDRPFRKLVTSRMNKMEVTHGKRIMRIRE